MVRTIVGLAVTGLILSLPAASYAGGPPRFVMPINGVSTDNVQACADLLKAKLADKLWTHGGEQNVQLHQHKNAWYATFYMGEDVALSDVEKALAGSKFSVPREKLHFFGHAVLEIQIDPADQKELLAELDKIGYLAVDQAQPKKERLDVIVDMPYPTSHDRRTVGWDSFQRNDLSSAQSRRSEPPATPQMLPSYEAIRSVVVKHKGTLTNIRWDNTFACRELGCVAASPIDAKLSAN